MSRTHRSDYSAIAHWAANATYDTLAFAAWVVSRRWKMDIEWREPLPEGRVIVAVNHPTSLDPFVIMRLVSRRMVFLTTYKLFYVPFLRTMLRAFGMIPAGEGNPRHALQDAIASLEEGHTLCVFPEGTISAETGTVSHPRSGPARIALGAQATVVPVGIYAPAEHIELRPITLRGHVEQVRWYPCGPYAVTFGSPMRFDAATDGAAVRQTSHQIVAAIADLVDAGRERVERAQSR